MKKVAVILSGSGVFDGAEIQESVIALLQLARSGASYQCFAPDIAQMHVINHLSGEVMEGEQRNVLVESARIARGDIQALDKLVVTEFDALLLPGGFGVAKNLSDFALAGAECQLNEQIEAVCRAFALAKKPAGYLCIAPALLPKIYPGTVKGTIGNDVDTAAAYQLMGGQHVDCLVDDIVIDSENLVVSSPAYMLASNICEAADGIEKLTRQLLAMC